ncbi:MAG: nodulation protein NfeD [Elusimicrobia bacterium]|nr:nodulation protein NfeD [Elusimicrobiota bacterium]
MRSGILAALLAAGASFSAPPKAPAVLVAPFAGVISPVAAEFLTGAVAAAQQGRYDALVIELDTPGGLDLSMRAIVQSILASKVPVVVYVYPSGARAASAGAFITVSAHVAAMAPGTNIGAAHPVTLPGIGGALPDHGKKGEGGEDAVMQGKMANDAAAYLQSLARERGRNEEWAAKAVKESVSAPVAEAVQSHIVDLQAPDLESLLTAIDGRKIPGLAGPLRTAGARVVRYEMSSRQRWLAAVSDPNVAMILMSLGAAGLFIELYSPGLILPGVVGAVCLVLAFYSFQTLSASYAGVLLILLGLLFFLLEVKVASFGLLAVAGVASTVLGILMLFQNQPTGGLQVAWSVIGATLSGLLALVALASYLVLQAHRRRKAVGVEGMIGQRAHAVTALNPAGKVRVASEIWDAVADSGAVAEGDPVIIEGVEGLTLKVRRP